MAQNFPFTDAAPAGGAAPTPTRLATVPAVKAFLRITVATYDALIDSFVIRASDTVERFCGRRFMLQTYYRERYDGDGWNVLYLDQYPVTAVRRLSLATRQAFIVSNGSTDAAEATVSVSATALTLTVVGGANAGTSTLALSGYLTLTALANAVNALGKGWTAASVSGSAEFWPASELIQCGAFDALRQSAYLELPDDSESAFTVDYATGAVVLTMGVFPKGLRNVVVTYSAGYSTIPPMLEQVCIELAAEMFQEHARDSTLASESLGDYSWSAAAQGATIRETLDVLLAEFRRLDLP